MLLKKFVDQELRREYGVVGVRTFPWPQVAAPFGSAYCIVEPHTDSLDHVNEPADEDEMFVCIRGNAEIFVGAERFAVRPGDQVFIPRGMAHFVRNETDLPFHFYAIWWNRTGILAFVDNEHAGDLAATA